MQNTNEPNQIPVYLFTGFLDSGKTKFIQETLEDERFGSDERTLLIMCEDGEEEYNPDLFVGDAVFIRSIDKIEDMSIELLDSWQRECDAERVLIEYNGMWPLDELYQRLPPEWVVYQEFMFADAGTFPSYNANMRSLVFDKIKSCELVVFNRADDDLDIMPYHKIVRAINRACDIAYEYKDGKVRYDDIVDPLPYDMNAPVIEIRDEDYAIWYMNLCENLMDYDDRTVRFKGQVSPTDELPKGSFIIGRQMMNCCADDITFAGLVAVSSPKTDFEDAEWVMLTAHINVMTHEAYDRPGPVLRVLEVESCEAAADEIATLI